MMTILYNIHVHVHVTIVNPFSHKIIIIAMTLNGLRHEQFTVISLKRGSAAGHRAMYCNNKWLSLHLLATYLQPQLLPQCKLQPQSLPQCRSLNKGYTSSVLWFSLQGTRVAVSSMMLIHTCIHSNKCPHSKVAYCVAPLCQNFLARTLVHCWHVGSFRYM